MSHDTSPSPNFSVLTTDEPLPPRTNARSISDGIRHVIDSAVGLARIEFRMEEEESLQVSC